LKFQGAKLAAHYFQEIMNLFKSDTEQILELPIKKLLLANALAGCIAIEIVGANVIKDLNRDWIAAAAFISYVL